MRHLVLLLSLFCLINTSSAQDKLLEQFEKGVAAFEKGNFAKAERFFDKLLKEEPSYAAVYLWKGKCLQEFEEYQAAYEAISTACNLDPTEGSYWFELGLFKYTIAITSIKKPELCGDCGKFLLPEGTSLKASYYYKSALKDYQKAVQLNPNYSEAYYQMGIAHVALSEVDKACLQLQKAVDLKHPKALKYRLEICPN
ncbi:MAG: tetratricopeptide repeat protein [Aureispira sp.]|nr:tetratricopeptide repeat protein [Aureispira sp.]